MAEKNKLLFNIRAEFCIVCVIFLFLFFVGRIPFSGYFDDLVAMLLTFPLLVGLLEKKYNKVEVRMICALSLVCLIGITSNLFSGIVTNMRYILNDAYSFIRIFLVYFGSIALLRGKPKAVDYLVSKLGTYSKIVITLAFAFGVLNHLGIVRMYSTVRFGLRNYHFFFGNASQFGIYIGCALAFLLLSGKSKILFELMALACLIMTFKGMGLIIAVVYIILVIFGHRKLKWWHIAIALAVLVYILQFQISSYILDATAPRAILIYYGFVTAIRFFPLGAGFASYGSNMAAVHYSPLYYEYGFQLRKALTVFNDGSGMTTYLNDAYLGMIAGQFGIIGLLLMTYIFYGLGKRVFNRTIVSYKAKYIVIACFGCFCGMAVMAGSIKTAGGELLVLVFAVYQLLAENNLSAESPVYEKGLRKN